MLGLYRLKDWNNTPKMMRASTIKNKIEKGNKKKNKNLFAPPSEIMKVCNKKKFPKEYAKEIKILIIEFFSKTKSDEFNLFFEKEEDRQAVYSAYNSLYGIDDQKVKNTRNKFLESFLMSIERNTYLYIIHQNKIYDEIKNNWIKRKKKELENRKDLNFQDLKVILIKDFKETIKDREEKGLLKKEAITLEEENKEDDKKFNESQTKVLKKTLTKDNTKRPL